MVSSKGPPLSGWNARKYVMSWLKADRHGAVGKATGLSKVVVKTEGL